MAHIPQSRIDNIQFIIDNQDEDFSPVMHSWIAETRIIKEIGGEQAPVNQEGYDYTHKVYNKVELKTVYERDWHSNGLLAIIGLKNKKNKCDYIHVHDGVNNRNFMIPHDVVFYEMKLMVNDNKFTFSGSYNKTDNQAIHNTGIMQKYEI